MHCSMHCMLRCPYWTGAMSSRNLWKSKAIRTSWSVLTSIEFFMNWLYVVICNVFNVYPFGCPCNTSTTEASGPTSECRRQCHKQSVWPSRLEHTRTRSRTAMQNCPRHGKWNWFRGRFLAKHEDAWSMLKSFALPLGIFPERKKYSGRALADLFSQNYFHKKNVMFPQGLSQPKSCYAIKSWRKKMKEMYL